MPTEKSEDPGEGPGESPEQSPFAGGVLVPRLPIPGWPLRRDDSGDPLRTQLGVQRQLGVPRLQSHAERDRPIEATRTDQIVHRRAQGSAPQTMVSRITAPPFVYGSPSFAPSVANCPFLLFQRMFG